MALAFTLATGSLHAETLLSPSVGLAFGGKTDDSKITYGGTLTLKGSLVGFAVDFGYTPDFFGSDPLGNNNLITLMGNLVVMSPGPVRVYGSAPASAWSSRGSRTRPACSRWTATSWVSAWEGVSSSFRATATWVFTATSVTSGSLTDPEPDDEFDVDLGNLDFWRGEIGDHDQFFEQEATMLFEVSVIPLEG